MCVVSVSSLDGRIDRQTDGQTDTQTHRQTDRQTDRQTQCTSSISRLLLLLLLLHTHRDTETDRYKGHHINIGICLSVCLSVSNTLQFNTYMHMHIAVYHTRHCANRAAALCRLRNSTVPSNNRHDGCQIWEIIDVYHIVTSFSSDEFWLTDKTITNYPNYYAFKSVIFPQ